jgi:hypothetical protein
MSLGIVIAAASAAFPPASAQALVVHDGRIYWIANQGVGPRGDVIGRMNVDGTGLRRRLVRHIGADRLAVGAGHVFWSGPRPGDDSGRKRAIGRARLDGRRVQRRLIETDANALAVHGRFLYWSGAKAIGRARVDGKQAKRGFLHVSHRGWALGDLVVGDAGIFWGEGLHGTKAVNEARHSGPTGRIGHAALSGRGIDVDFASWRSAALIAFGPRLVGLDGPSLYWFTPNPDNVLHHLDATAVNVGYCEPVFSNCEVLMRLADAGVNPNSSFTVDDGVLYWAEPVPRGTRIYRSAIVREPSSSGSSLSEMLGSREQVALVRDSIR